MKYQYRTVLSAAILALVISPINSAVAADTATQDIVEVRQETQIWTTYVLSPYLRASDIKVVVRSGKATLTGLVDESVNKDLAKQIALGVSGIKEVDNQIIVQADYVAPARNAERNFGEVVDDASITAAVKAKLLWSMQSDGMSTEVVTQRGKVTLQGTADSAAARDRAGRLALRTNGVVSVDNQLTIVTGKLGLAASAKATANEGRQDIADSWITTKVKSTFLYSDNVGGSGISVSTSAGVVTLTGKVESGAERALAIELARNVRGVRSVQSKGLRI